MITKNVSIENAKIGYRNFSGKESVNNKAGDRNFCVFLEDSLGAQMKEEGWNVKYTRPDDEGNVHPYLPVAIRFDMYPPKVIQYTSEGRTTLDEDNIGNLDGADIENVDLIIRPYNWSRSGNSGVKAYVKSMYVTLAEDAFERKYAARYADRQAFRDAVPDDDNLPF